MRVQTVLELWVHSCRAHVSMEPLLIGNIEACSWISPISRVFRGCVHSSYSLKNPKGLLHMSLVPHKPRCCYFQPVECFALFQAGLSDPGQSYPLSL